MFQCNPALIYIQRSCHDSITSWDGFEAGSRLVTMMMMMIIFPATFYPAGVLGRAHDGGEHS
jgi:hypothetical protein